MKFFQATADSGTAGHEKIWGGLGVAAIFAALVVPLDRLGFLACPLKSATGLPCFLCGGTRGFLAAARFDFAAAWGYNPLAMFLFAGLLLYVPYALGAVAFSWPRPRLRLETDRERNVLRFLIVAAVVANWAWLIIRPS
jgi:hypothetical protein